MFRVEGVLRCPLLRVARFKDHSPSPPRHAIPTVRLALPFWSYARCWYYVASFSDYPVPYDQLLPRIHRVHR